LTPDPEAGSSPVGPAGALVVVTGPSHAGKSTLIGELRSRLDRPAATVAIDELMERSSLPLELRWEHGLTDTYDAAARQSIDLLTSGLVVFYESTFTYIPPDERPPQFHLDQLHRLLGLAREAGAAQLVVQLTTTSSELERRRSGTQRLDSVIVAETWRQHSSARLQVESLLRLDTSRLSAAEAADSVLSWLKTALAASGGCNEPAGSH
jgi:predicted kinase